jgi:thioester reductase-like protein
MQYFVTGAMGFIGKRLLNKPLARKSSAVHFLIRKKSESKVSGLRQYCGASAARVIPVFGETVANFSQAGATTII